MLEPTCPTGCADVAAALPTVLFDDCNPEINQGEIRHLYLAPKGNPFTAWTSATEWAARLAAVDATKIIRLTVLADKPAPTANSIDISGGRKVTLAADHVINFQIDETNATNHEMVRKIECGGNFDVWYETSGGLMFGGNDGIPGSIGVGMVIPRTVGERITYDGSISWKSRFTEERIVSPIA